MHSNTQLDCKIAEQHRKSSPFYLARRFDDWSVRTGVLNGSGLTWLGRLPVGVFVILVSVVYWLAVGRKVAKI